MRRSSSIVSGLPPTVDAKPHCGQRPSRSSGACSAARSISPRQVVGVLEPRRLGRHQPEHRALAGGHEAQRREAAGARGVELEQEGVDRRLAEQPLGDRLVAALGQPAALVVAAAQVHRETSRGALRAWWPRPPALTSAPRTAGRARRGSGRGSGRPDARDPRLRRAGARARRGRTASRAAPRRAGGSGRRARRDRRSPRDRPRPGPRRTPRDRDRRAGSIPAAPRQKCMVGGEGSVIFARAPRRAREEVELGARDRAAPREPSGGVRRQERLLGCRTRRGSVKRAGSAVMPSTRSTKRDQYEARRNSPSVIASSPASSCSATASRMARSWIASSSSSERRFSLQARCASRSSGGRSRLPT